MATFTACGHNDIPFTICSMHWIPNLSRARGKWKNHEQSTGQIEESRAEHWILNHCRQNSGQNEESWAQCYSITPCQLEESQLEHSRPPCNSIAPYNSKISSILRREDSRSQSPYNSNKVEAPREVNESSASAPRPNSFFARNFVWRRTHLVGQYQECEVSFAKISQAI